ncbi:hypothetical protein [Gordonia alkaliphila]|uniref:DUF222 domain-containing protein n=1 Tax=Gordonia alkaliphila TaxID=1053547 RepID=A0ABP8YZ07_9ACTN
MGPRSNWNIDIAELLARIDSMDPGGATADAAEIRRIMNAARAIAVRLLLRFDQMDGLAGVGAVAADEQGTALGKRIGEVADRLSPVAIAVDAASGDLAASVAARPALLATVTSGGGAAAAQVARERVMQQLYSDPMSPRSDGLAGQSGSAAGVGGPALGPMSAGTAASNGVVGGGGDRPAGLAPEGGSPTAGAPAASGPGGRTGPAGVDRSITGGPAPSGGPAGGPTPPGGPTGAPAGAGPTGSPPLGAPPVAVPPPSTVPTRPAPVYSVRPVLPVVGSTLRLPGVPAAPSPGAPTTAAAPPVRPLGSPTAGPASAVPSGRGGTGNGAGPLGSGGVRGAGAEEEKRRRPGYLLSSLEFARLVGPMPVAGPAVLGEPEPASSDVAVDEPDQSPTDDDDQELDLTL